MSIYIAPIPVILCYLSFGPSFANECGCSRVTPRKVHQCNQEEADGHPLLYAAHAAREGCEAVVICSEVFIMTLAFHNEIAAQL